MTTTTTPQPADLLEAFTRSSDAVFAVDQNMRIVFWNLAAERIFGVDESAAVGRRCDDLVAGFETNGALLCSPDCRIMACSRRGHATETYDLVRRDVAGRQQWLNVSIIVLRGSRRSATLTVHLLRDVTARRAVEQRAGALLASLHDAPPGGGGLPPAITRREADVLRLVANGVSNAAIAETLGISRTTVRNHIEHLLAKLGVHSKLEAVICAARSGLI